MSLNAINDANININNNNRTSNYSINLKLSGKGFNENINIKPNLWCKFDTGAITTNNGIDDITLTNYGYATNADIFVKGNNSLSLNGTNQYLTGTLTNIANNSFSVSVWLYSKTGDTTKGIVLTIGTTYTTNETIFFGFGVNSLNRYFFGFYANDAYSSLTFEDDINNWVHITWVYNSLTKELMIYRNGYKIELTNAISPSQPIPNTNIIIGSLNGSTYFYNGYINDLRIYTGKILSQEEITAIYNDTNNTNDYNGFGFQLLSNTSNNRVLSIIDTLNSNNSTLIINSQSNTYIKNKQTIINDYLSISSNNFNIGTTDGTSNINIIGDINLNGDFRFNNIDLTSSNNTLFLKSNEVNISNLFIGSNIIIGGSIFKPDGSIYSSSSTKSSQWSNSTINQSNIYYNNGFIGIGIDNPQSLIHVASINQNNDVILKLTDSNTGYLSNNGLILQKNSNQDGLLWNYQNTDLIFGTYNNERVRIKNNGNIGIGTTNPNYLLDINGNTNVNEIFIKDTNISNIIDDKITITSNILVDYNNFSNKPNISNYATITNVDLKQSKLTFNNPILSNITNIVSLKIDSSLIIDGSGNLKVVGASSQWTTNETAIYYNGGDIGIGINSPSSLLHLHKSGVNQAIRLQFTDGAIGSLSTNGFLIYKGTDHNAYIYNQENKDLIFRTNNIQIIIIKNDGLAIFRNDVNIDAGLALTGSSAFVNNTNVDSGNITNTYINFKEAGSTNDWCYLRQIGTANNYKLALDFHDDGTDANFVIRNVNSVANTDTITEVFSVNNNYTNINGLRIGGGDTTNTIYQATGNIGISANQSTANIIFNINSTEILKITPDTINSTKRLYLTSTNISDNTIILNSASPYGYGFGLNSTTIIWYGVPASCSHIFYIGGTETFNINSSTIKTQKNIELAHTTNPAILFSGFGDSAIAVTSTAGTYSTTSITGDMVIRSQTDKKIILQNSSGLGTLFIKNGNVGISNDNPTSILDVIGNIKVSGDILNSAGNSIIGSIIPSQWTVNSTNIYFNNSGSIAIGKATNNTAYKLEVINNAIIGTEVIEKNGFDHSIAPLTLTNQESYLYDLQPILYLCRQGTTGQSYGTRASFYINKNESTRDSRTNLYFALTHNLYFDNIMMTLKSDGCLSIGEDTLIKAKLHIALNSANVGMSTCSLYVNNPNNTTNSTSIILARIASSVGNLPRVYDNALYGLDVLNSHGWSMYINGNDTTNKTLRFNNTNNASSATDYFVIRGDNNNVGIGNAVPTYKLQIEQGSMFIGNSTYTGTSVLSTANAHKLIFDNTYNASDGSGTPNNKISLYNNNTNLIGLSSDNSGIAYNTKTTHKFYTETTNSAYGTLGLTLSANNFNFVGNTTTQTLLSLQNTNTFATISSVFRLINDNSANYFNISLSSTTETPASVVVLKNYATGYLGIVNSVNNGVVFTPTETVIYNATNNDILFHTNATERLRIKNDGKIGVGIANPQYLFDINGDMRLSGELRKADGTLVIPPQTLQINTNTMYSNTELNIFNLNIYSSNPTVSSVPVPNTSALVTGSTNMIYTIYTTNSTITFSHPFTVDVLVIGAGGNGGIGAYSGGGGGGEVIYYPNFSFNVGTYNLNVGISTNNPINRISKITQGSIDLIKANGGGNGGYNNISFTGTNNFSSFVFGLLYYKYISFINSGTITLKSSIVCDVLIVGGGGAGGVTGGGGGGAGGLIYLSNQTISSGTYNVVVGAGGTASSAADNTMKGGDSSFNGVIAYGGGGGEHMGAAGSATALSYTNGGSGGGGERLSHTDTSIAGRDGGSGVSGQGNNGGQGKNASGLSAAGGGGGGAGAVGQSAFTAGRGGNGGIGSQISITGTNTYYAGGGGGGSGSDFTVAGTGGSGGGGNGAISNNVGTNGTNGLGGGGGGGAAISGGGQIGGSGGSGIVIIRYLATYEIIQPTSGGSDGFYTIINTNTSNILVNQEFYIKYNNDVTKLLPGDSYNIVFNNGNITVSTPSLSTIDYSYPILKNFDNPILWYKFDDSSLYLNDAYNSVNNLTNNGATYDTTSFIKGNGSIKFVALSSHYVTIPPNNNINAINAANGITISLWFKMTTSSPNWARVFDFGTRTTDNTKGSRYISLMKYGYQSYLQAEIGYNVIDGNEAGERSAAIFSNDLLVDNTWRHFVWTINSTGYWNIYVNGVNKYSVNTGKIIPEFTRTKYYWLGKSLFNSDGYFDGNIDDFRIYDFVISENQVTELYKGRVEIYQNPTKMGGGGSGGGGYGSYITSNLLITDSTTVVLLYKDSGSIKNNNGTWSAIPDGVTQYNIVLGGQIIINNLSIRTNYPTLLKNPILWYRFDESSTYLNDEYYSSNNLTNTNGSYTTSTNSYIRGTGGLKIITDAYGDMVSIPPNININTVNEANGITFSCFVYFTKNYSGIYSFGITANNNGFTLTTCIAVWLSGNIFYFLNSFPSDINNLSVPSYEYIQYSISGLSISTYTWYHLVWSISNTGVWKIYVNAVSQSVSITKKIPNLNYSDKTKYYSIGYLYGTGVKPNLHMDDFRIYDYVLSQDEVSLLYKGTVEITYTFFRQNGAVRGNKNNIYSIDNNDGFAGIVASGKGGNGGSALTKDVGYTASITGNSLIVGKGGLGATATSVAVNGTNYGEGGSGNGGVGSNGVIIFRWSLNQYKNMVFSNTYNTINNLNISNILTVGNRIGINNSSPSCSLDIIGNNSTNTFTTYIGLLKYIAGTETTVNATVIDFIVKASGSIWSTTRFVASSDERIKTNINDINDDNALQKILKIDPKTYNYIDYITKGTCNVYGFIAQQIKKHIPEAITITSEYIPNIYKVGSISNLNEITIDNNCNLLSTIKINDNVKIITENNQNNEYIITDIISSNCFKINSNLFDEKCIVYGTKVSDFHTLDKNYIYTLNVCANQELYKLTSKNQDNLNQIELSIEQLKQHFSSNI